MPDNFGTANFSDNAETVFNNLSNPNKGIEKEGGYLRFINCQILPIDRRHSKESYAALPNYALHLLGGGLVYRKDLEWFQNNNYTYILLCASSLVK